MPVHLPVSRRLEWKYRVPAERAGELHAALASRTSPDAHCTGPAGTYPVRSVYYDTPGLRFYHERRDGVRVRRKLRVRNYGNGHCFLEIKRKLDQIVLKERVPLSSTEVMMALDGADPAVLMDGRSENDLRVLERFRHNLHSLGLVPMLLVAYERRAMVGLAQPDLRITLDHDLQGRSHPRPEALFEEEGLQAFESHHLLEIKFAGRPPRWLLDVVTAFQLKRESYSKYCEGIDRCANGADGVRANGTDETSSP